MWSSGEEKDDAFEDSSFVVELLNGRNRNTGVPRHRGKTASHEPPDAREAERLIREMTAGSAASDAAEDRFPAWHDSSEYARAAEAAGVDVHGMLEAGVDTGKLVDFVSNYRKAEGDKLRLLDGQNLKFATSQVLHRGQRARLGAVNIPTGDLRPLNEKRAPAASWEFNADTAKGGRSRTIADSLRRERKQTHRQSAMQDDHNQNRGDLGSTVGHRGGDGAGSAGVAPRIFGEDDGVETARLCNELLHWSSTVVGAEGELGGMGAAGADERKGGRRSLAQGAQGSPPEHVVKSADDSVSCGEEGNHERMPDHGHDEGLGSHVDKENDDTGRAESAYISTRESDSKGARSQRHELFKIGDRRGRSCQNDLENAVDWDLADGDQPLNSWSGRLSDGVRDQFKGKGQPRATPSYALPTKHFKMPSRDGGDTLAAEERRRQKQLQRKAYLDEENSALKLRLEGQRRAIHELEHQASTLREEAREREDDVSRLKRKLATIPSTTAQGTCSCCASTHQARARYTGDSGTAALKKRALAAEARTRELERSLADSRAKEQRAREIGALLKYKCSGAQERAAALDVELTSVKKEVLEARRKLEESRKDSKANVKATRKHQRQQDEKTREVEIARAEAADLAVQLRKALKELEAARVEVAALRKEKMDADTRAGDLARENGMLLDRLPKGQPRSMTRERDRWIVSELRSEFRSPIHVPAVKPSKECREHSHSLSSRRQVFPGSPSSSDDDGLRTRGRRRRLGESALDPSSAFESPKLERDRSSSAGKASDSHGDDPKGQTIGGGEKLSPRYGQRQQRYADGERWSGGVPRAEKGGSRGLSTRSADGTEGDALEGVPRGTSTVSVGGNRSTMGARYERLQAMYRRVNRRDAGMRGRAGVG